MKSLRHQCGDYIFVASFAWQTCTSLVPCMSKELHWKKIYSTLTALKYSFHSHICSLLVLSTVLLQTWFSCKRLNVLSSSLGWFLGVSGIMQTFNLIIGRLFSLTGCGPGVAACTPNRDVNGESLVLFFFFLSLCQEWCSGAWLAPLSNVYRLRFDQEEASFGFFFFFSQYQRTKC